MTAPRPLVLATTRPCYAHIMTTWRVHPHERLFGHDLRVAREHMGLSQAAVAHYMEESGFGPFYQQTIARIENGQRSVRLGEATALAALTGMSLDDGARTSQRYIRVMTETADALEVASGLLTDVAVTLRERVQAVLTGENEIVPSEGSEQP